MKEKQSQTATATLGGTPRRVISAALAAASISIASGASAAPGVPSNGRVSFGEFFSETNGNSQIGGLSDDARYVLFQSQATNITDEDPTNGYDVYRYDRFFGITLLMSVATNGMAGNNTSFVGAIPSTRMISSDGRYALFTSGASNLIAGDTNNNVDVFIRDTNGFGATQRVSLGAGGAQITGGSLACGMTPNAQKILFTTDARLVAKDTNNLRDGYLYDRVAKTITLVSSTAAGNAVGADYVFMSENARYFVFYTSIPLVPQDGNLASDVYWKDLQTGALKVASAFADGGAAGFNATQTLPTISADGQRVAFNTVSSVIASDTNGTDDLYVRDMVTNTVYRASTTSGGSQVNDPHCAWPSLSGNGHVVAMNCQATMAGDQVGIVDIFTKDLDTNVTTLISRVQNGPAGNNHCGTTVITKDAAQVGFTSGASNLTTPASNGFPNAFVGTRQ